MEELKKKILNDIKKSGFLAEMKANQILVKSGWQNTHNASTFLDKDMEKSREIDITTYKNKNDKEKNISLGIHLIIEVKKSDKPWIIFCQDRNAPINRGLGWGILNFADNVNRQNLQYNDINLKNRHSNSLMFGTSYYEAFKEPSESSQVYSALMTSCKASVFKKKQNSWEIEDKKYDPNKNHHVEFFLPIVVLEGLLFQSTLNEIGEIQLNQVNYAPIKLNYSSKNYKESTFYPEIVTMDGLQEHLEKIDEWFDSLFIALKNNIQIG
ncbi:hypothetical protein [Flavobacterium sp.]|uniref:hypothetical protein n=1 Tax=Flavobacterium sp. TaxID=239 RepID=UPI0026017EBD|nr:hypothetical protein [Flavobacterium sp.]